MVALWALPRVAIKAALLLSAWWPPFRPWFANHAQELAALYHIVRMLLMSGSIPWIAWHFFGRPVGMVVSMRYALKNAVSTLVAVAPLGGVPLPCMRYAVPILVINALLPAIELVVHYAGFKEKGVFWLMPPEAVAANAAASFAGLAVQDWGERQLRTQDQESLLRLEAPAAAGAGGGSKSDKQKYL